MNVMHKITSGVVSLGALACGVAVVSVAIYTIISDQPEFIGVATTPTTEQAAGEAQTGAGEPTSDDLAVDFTSGQISATKSVRELFAGGLPSGKLAGSPNVTYENPTAGTTSGENVVNLRITFNAVGSPSNWLGKPINVYLLNSNRPINNIKASGANYTISRTNAQMYFNSGTQKLNLTVRSAPLLYSGKNYLTCILELVTETGSLLSYCGRNGAPTSAEIDYTGNLIPVFRFYNAGTGRHFYTANSVEASDLNTNNPSWALERIAMFVPSKAKCANSKPVYRFWSASSQSHFYTTSDAEKSNLIANNPSWSFEGHSFCAASAPAAGLSPVYRFWKDSTRSHFFTISEAEKNNLELNDPSWKFERIAFYATRP